MTTDPNCGHHESCACLRPGDNECNCHKAYGFDTVEAMEAADAPGVAVVTDKMVERAAKAYCKWFVCGSNGVNTLALRAALTAALAPKPEGEL